MRSVHCLLAAIGLLLTAELLSAQDRPDLLLFGGKGHKVFLGCLNCPATDSGSVCNEWGDNGSKYQDESIWNQYGDYGSRYSDMSPWNRFASKPPVIVDREGNFYGYFTADKFHDKRTRNKFLLVFLNNVDEVNDDLQKARNLFCKEK
jgi:hypothetical protein